MKTSTKLLFDLDGTLVDSAPDIASALDHALLEHDLPAAGIANCREWIGGGVDLLVERALAANNRTCEATKEVVLAEFLRQYRQINGRTSQLYPGAAATLEHLRTAGFPMACVTNKPEAFALALLDALNIRAYFPVVIGGDTLAQKKPHPAPLHHARDQLNSEATDALMIGDSKTDQKAAAAAGIPFVWISHGYHRGETKTSLQPLHAIDYLSELQELLKC